MRYVAQEVDWTVDSLHCEEQKKFFLKCPKTNGE